MLFRSISGLPLVQANIFFLKLNRILTKNDISWYVKSGPTHPLASIRLKLWEDSICEWPLKTNRPSFCLIFKTFSCAGLSVQCVISGLYGYKHKCVFCWIKDQSLNMTTLWRYCWLELFLVWNPLFLFSDIDAVAATFHVLVNTYFLNFRLALLIVLGLLFISYT